MTNLYCIRHGLALHNSLYKKYGSDIFCNINYKDTLLIPEGHEQSLQLGETWKDIDKIELVIVSPLKRTLQTAHNIFKNKKIPMIALDICREFPLGLHACNYRSSKDELEILYPNVDFSSLKTNYDELWFPKREETIEELNIRIKKTLEFIKSRPETNIAFVNHNSFMGQMKDNKILLMDNGSQELKHCFPYLMTIE